jgi:sigma-B regulation protein RsbU (phosphoserine phosphatase)
MSEFDTLLIIDDEAVVRQSLQEYLEDSGFATIEADSGKQGLEKFRAEKPNLILTDIRMNDMNGLDLLGTITQESPDTPVIVISGAGVMNDAIKALRLGAWDYFIKPIQDMAVLEHSICKALERSRLVEENERYKTEIEVANENLKKTLEELEQDLQAGRSVQSQLSPSEVFVDNAYKLSFKIKPSLYLSGDFIDYFKISDKLLAFYVADVSGHGASSAFVTVLLKSLMNQIHDKYQVEHDPTILDPAAVLQTLSARIHTAKLGKYLTMVYSVLDMEKNELCYAIGGHYPNPILYDETKTDFLPGKGFPVGIMSKANYENHKLTLPERFNLAMFSDGIMEVLPADELKENEETILKVIGQSGVSIENILSVCGVNDKPAWPDDVTVLLLQRT